MCYNKVNERKEGFVMEFNTVLQAITTVGFPIVMCLLLMWYIKDNNDKHDVEISTFTEAINKNTLMIERLCHHLDVKISEEEK